MPRLLFAAFLALAMISTACGGKSGSKGGESPKKSADKVTEAKAALKSAKAAEKDGDADLAGTKYKRALKLRPSHFETVERYTRFLIKQSEPQSAVRVSSNYLSRSVGELKGYHLVADAQMAAGDWKGAETTLSELLELDNGDSIAFQKRATVHVENKDNDSALADIDKALELDKDNADLHATKGMVLQSSGELEGASKSLNKAIKLDPGHGKAQLYLGIVLRDEGENDKALEAHKKAAAALPELAEAHFQLGMSLFLAQQNDKAETSLKKAVEMDKSKKLYWYVLGQLYRLTERADQSVEPYKKAIAIDADFVKAVDKLGRVMADDAQGSVDFFSERVQSYPDEGRSWLYLGQAYDKLKQYPEAYDALKKYLIMTDKDDKGYSAVKKRVKKLKRLK